MLQPLDYTFEILIVLGLIILAFHGYVKYVRVDKTCDGDKLLDLYLDTERLKCRNIQR